MDRLNLTINDACDLYRVLDDLITNIARQVNTPGGLNLDEASTKALQQAFDALAKIDSKDGAQ